MTMHAILTVSAILALAACAAAAAGQSGALRAVAFTDVRIADEFWSTRIETNRTRSIPHNFKWCRQTGRFTNFAKAGKVMKGKFEGIYFNDSDVYKLLEGASYSLQAHPDPKLEKQVDEVIAWIAAAQEPNGYLNSYYTLKAPYQKWTHLRHMHELYCAGHLFEAAVAHYRATGKRTLLDVAVKFADRIDEIFGPDDRHDVPGHEEIELALVKLSQATGEKKYFDLAKFFLDIRGRTGKRRPKTYGPYCQDHQPVVEQSEPTGHAVRAMYLYAGMADVAAATGDKAYIEALGRLWMNTVERKMYITGAVGSTRRGEAFGGNYDLPNATAYAETCASIGMCLWNHRMNLLHADARYADAFERSLFNGVLAGIDLGGEKFFYVNPLASEGKHHRQEFFGCACCPTNVVRFIPSVPGYVYAASDTAVYVNLYTAGTGEVSVGEGKVELKQQTRYPWDGNVKITVKPDAHLGGDEFDVMLRIPAWTVAKAPADALYQPEPMDVGKVAPTIRVNGEAVANPEMVKGYARLSRKWQAGDTIELHLPMPVRRVRAHPSVSANAGRVALQRGPIVYCFESADNPDGVDRRYLPADAAMTAEFRKDLLGGVTVIKTKARATPADGAKETDVEMTAIPYYAWDHREAGPMAVWMAEDAPTAKNHWKPVAGAIASKWAEQVSPDSALPEYPRPQMVRKDWLNLNGLWQYAEGKAGEAAPTGKDLDGRILVPFCVESSLGGVGKHTDRLWYRRTFTVPAGWKGKHVLLHFGAVDWEAEVFLNGESLGDHRGGYDAFGFDVTDKLRQGENELIVRVFDPTDKGRQPRGKQVLRPRGIWYTPVTGIWQTVWLEPVEPVSVESMVVTPDIDAECVKVTVKARGDWDKPPTIQVTALDGDKQVAAATGAPGEPIILPIKSPRLWSPDEPFLYGLEVAVGDDNVESYFGMRKTSIGKGEDGHVRLLLNNEFVFQIGLLDQGFWPDGIYTAPTDAALRYDIEATRAMGFNMARKHVKVEPERWYHWADKIGLLVWQDMPGGFATGKVPEGKKADHENFRRELGNVMEAFRFHPSIVAWIPYNEGWGQPDAEGTNATLQWTKKKDPSR
jgi:DUF1680 family protein